MPNEGGLRASLARSGVRYDREAFPAATSVWSFGGLVMRTIIPSFLLLAVTPLLALAQQAPPSAANLVKLHPGPWQIAAPIVAGMRFDPETGEASVVEGTPGTSGLALARSQAEARALAAQNVTRHADGSRHAVVGGAFRMWTVATIDDQGALTQDCVSSEAEVRSLVEAAARKQVRK